jgi:glucose-6-phosphate 1-dehydrogenase
MSVAAEASGGVITRGGCEIEIPAPFALVIFGASGDLTRRKILPAIFRLQTAGLLPRDSLVLGTARTGWDDEGFREEVRGALEAALPGEFTEEGWGELSGRLYYAATDYADPETYRAIEKKLLPLEERHRTLGNRIFYLAVPPQVCETAVLNLGQSGLSREERGFAHVVIEKPFGRDLDSAAGLNRSLRRSFQERQIYRMDHYLAKETVQDILMFRFANSIFEPLWNRRYIDHVQITASETLGVEHRAGYYEGAGVLRDMFQNHMFQLLALTAMEPPSVFEADRVRDEKVKVFRSIRPFPLKRPEEHVAVGQYGAGSTVGGEVPAYRAEPGVAADSMTPTYAAMKVYIDNWRWNGVPFYLRSGKRLKRKKAEISIHYRHVPHLMFAGSMQGGIEPNTLVLRVQPEEGINLHFQTKLPGAKVCLNPVVMDFSYPKVLMLEAYERVLLDCMQGDQMLFVREDGVEQSWRLLSPVIGKLESEAGGRVFPNYTAGSEGPPEAARLIERDGRSWRPL